MFCKVLNTHPASNTHVHTFYAITMTSAVHRAIKMTETCMLEALEGERNAAVAVGAPGAVGLGSSVGVDWGCGDCVSGVTVGADADESVGLGSSVGVD